MSGNYTDIGSMLTNDHLIQLADEYGRAVQVEEKTVSSRVFQDSKKLSAIRAGADITVGRFNAAFEWFSRNWPDGFAWPRGVCRPSIEENRPDKFDGLPDPSAGFYHDQFKPDDTGNPDPMTAACSSMLAKRTAELDPDLPPDG